MPGSCNENVIKRFSSNSLLQGRLVILPLFILNKIKSFPCKSPLKIFCLVMLNITGLMSLMCTVRIIHGDSGLLILIFRTAYLVKALMILFDYFCACLYVMSIYSRYIL